MNKSSRRIRRMEKYTKSKPAALNLVSLMDVFTILVFFLLVNSSTSQVTQPPKDMELPASYVQMPPAETVVVVVSNDAVMIDGEQVYNTALLEDSEAETIEAITVALTRLQDRKIGLTDGAGQNAVTVLADKLIPYRSLKKVMSSCAAAGYAKISLAVINKAYKG